MGKNGNFGHQAIKFFLILAAILITSCTSISSALPQASIPTPEEDAITISSPNALGEVTVTAPADTVPDSSTLVVSVGSNSSDLTTPDFIPVAFAGESSCTADLPSATCPSLDSDNRCQASANSDGSFTVLVTATSSQNISVEYVKSSDCSLVSVLDSGTPSSDIVSLDFENATLEVDWDDGVLYALGQKSDGTDHIITFDTTTHELIADYTLSITGTPRRITPLPYQVDSDSRGVLVEADDDSFIAILNNGTVESELSVGTGPSELVSGVQLAEAVDMVITDSDLTIGEFSCTSYTAGTYKRVFFGQDASQTQGSPTFYIMDSFIASELGSDFASARRLTIDLTGYYDASTIQELNTVVMTANESIFSFILARDAGDQTDITVISIPNNGFCDLDDNGNLTVVPLDNQMLNFSVAGSNLHFIPNHSESTDGLFSSLFEQSTETLIWVDHTNLTEEETDLSGIFPDLTTTIQAVVPSTTIANDTATFYAIANDNDGWGRLTSDINNFSLTYDDSVDANDLLVTEGTSFLVNQTLNQGIIADTGNANDNISTVRFIDLPD